VCAGVRSLPVTGVTTRKDPAVSEHPSQEQHPHGLSPSRHHDPVAVARGFLAVALQRCDPASDEALEICAAWAELDEPGAPPEQVDADVPDVFPPDVILGIARNVLHAGIFTVIPARRVYALAWAIRHLDTAVDHLTAGLRATGPATP
jgi:hypothetical protein